MQLHQKLLNEISAVRNQLEEIKAMVLSKPCPDGLDMIWKLSIIILPVIFVLAAFALESRGAQRLSERALRCLEEELLKRKCGEEESKPMGEEGEVFLPSFLSSPLSAFHKAVSTATSVFDFYLVPHSDFSSSSSLILASLCI